MPQPGRAEDNRDSCNNATQRRESAAEPSSCRLRTCCFFASLRTGCYICGIYSLNECLLYLFGTTSIITRYIKQDFLSSIHCHDGSVTVNGTRVCNDGETVNHHYPPQLMPLMVRAFVILLFTAIMSVLLLIGVKKKRPMLIKPWLWFTLFTIVLRLSTTNHQNPFTVVTRLYCYLVVSSYVQELKEEQRRAARVVEDGEVTGLSLQQLSSPSHSTCVTQQPSAHERIFLPPNNSEDHTKTYSVGESLDRPPPYSCSQIAFTGPLDAVPSTSTDVPSTSFVPPSGVRPCTPPPSYEETIAASSGMLRQPHHMYTTPVSDHNQTGPHTQGPYVADNGSPYRDPFHPPPINNPVLPTQPDDSGAPHVMETSSSNDGRSAASGGDARCAADTSEAGGCSTPATTTTTSTTSS